METTFSKEPMYIMGNDTLPQLINTLKVNKFCSCLVKHPRFFLYKLATKRVLEIMKNETQSGNRDLIWVDSWISPATTNDLINTGNLHYNQGRVVIVRIGKRKAFVPIDVICHSFNSFSDKVDTNMYDRQPAVEAIKKLGYVVTNGCKFYKESFFSFDELLYDMKVRTLDGMAALVFEICGANAITPEEFNKTFIGGTSNHELHL